MPNNENKLGFVKGALRRYDAKSTGKHLVTGGATEYKILLPQGYAEDEFLSAAVEDLKFFFEEATGIALATVTDNAPLPQGKYLSVGKTSIAARVDATEKELTKGGFKIKTVDDNICALGATNEATMYAVYAFLRETFGFEQYYTDFYTLDRGVSEIELMDYDVVDVPDFEYRIQSSGWIRWNDKNCKRLRWTKNEKLFIPVDEDKMVWHNTFAYLPPEKYKAEHPAWYADPAAMQLCYTAHGNEAEREQMLDLVAGRIQELFSMEKYRNYDWVTVSIQDNQEGCTCPTCAAAKAKYGADAGVIVPFCNDVAKRVTAWMQTEEGKPYYRENYRIFFFAYHATNAAPVKYDEETGKYLPVDDSVICDEHVVPYFAETNGDYLHNFHDEGTANTVIGKNMKGWGALSKELYFWSYSTNFCYFLLPYNSFDVVQDTMKFAKIEGCKFAMIQDQWIQENAQTGFGIFKNWMHSKLLWDVNVDMQALTEQFFNAYFREAAPTMLQVFYEWREWAKYQRDVLGYNGYRSVYYQALDARLWPQEKVAGWLALTEKAKEDVAIYKESDPALYEELRKHIDTESISYRYILLSLYEDRYTKEETLAMREIFKADVEKCGMNLLNSMNSPINTFEKLFKSWEA